MSFPLGNTEEDPATVTTMIMLQQLTRQILRFTKVLSGIKSYFLTEDLLFNFTCLKKSKVN